MLINFDAGITKKERRKRKRMNVVTTGCNFGVWLLECLATIQFLFLAKLVITIINTM